MSSVPSPAHYPMGTGFRRYDDVGAARAIFIAIIRPAADDATNHENGAEPRTAPERTRLCIPAPVLLVSR